MFFVFLAVKSRYQSGGSRTSVSSGSGKAFRKSVLEVKRDPEAVFLDFSFTFRGVQAEMFKGKILFLLYIFFSKIAM